MRRIWENSSNVGVIDNLQEINKLMKNWKSNLEWKNILFPKKKSDSFSERIVKK